MDASNVKSLELLKKQADWCLAMNDPKSAWYVCVRMYILCVVN